MWKRLVGKQCKFVLKDGGKVYAVYGTVIDANDSFIVNRDHLGRLHFLNVDMVEKVSEVSASASGKASSQATQKEPQKFSNP